ncbi:PDZ domain-containing protein [Sphingobium fuliginis]|nr:PDZ domain-containing protein [Sphingobium fuliginis]
MAIARPIAMIIAALGAVTPGVTQANDWEKFYQPLIKGATFIPAEAPEVVSSSGNPDSDVEGMWRKGFAAIGVSAFNSPNSKTADAIKFGKKLKARYVMLGTKLTSSNTTAVPFTMPTSNTTVTNGTASVNSGGRFATGTYSGTSTTYGSQTSYIPITVNRFDKMAVYFAEVPKTGIGVMTRDLTPEEVAALETRRAIAIRFVRDNSPAYLADILPGDIITQLDGQPFDGEKWKVAAVPGATLRVQIVRGGQRRLMNIPIAADWHP